MAAVPYTPPSWAATGEVELWLEVVREGAVIGRVDFDEGAILLGRLPNCDVQLEHPSVSRYHAVLQVGDDNEVYVYDLGSTHGTRVNKSDVPKRKFVRLRIGHIVRVGQSSRLFVLQAPQARLDVEAERLEAVTERALARKRELEQQKRAEADRGIGWGMTDDYSDIEQQPSSDFKSAQEQPSSMVATQDGSSDGFYEEDPRKALRTFFEREGVPLNFDVEEDGPGHARVYTCKIQLPIDDEDAGGPVVAEASVQGKKRDATAAAALAACRILDNRGVLSSKGAAKARIAKRKARAADDDGDDTFFDRTGDVEAKRLRRARRERQKTETYSSLTERKTAILSELANIQNTLASARAEAKAAETASGLDPLDAFLEGMHSTLNDDSLARMKRQERVLQKELAEIESLLVIVKPALDDVVPLLPPTEVTQSTEPSTSTSKAESDQTTSVVTKCAPGIAARAPGTDTADTPASELLASESDSHAQRGKEESGKVDFSAPAKIKKRKVYGVSKPTRSQLESAQAAMDRKEGVQDSDWVAPEDQSGDGRTELNAKLGY